MRVRVRVLALVEQQLGGCLAQLVRGLADRGDRDRGRCGEFDVVVADQRQVFGDAHARPQHLAHESHRQKVVRAQHRAREVFPTARQQAPGGLGAGAGVHGRHQDVARRGAEAQSGRTQGPAHAVAAVVALTDRQRAADERERLVSGGDQVVGRQLPAGHVVDGDRAQVGAFAAAVEQHDGHAAAAQRVDRQRGFVRGRDQHAAYALLLEHLQIRLLLRHRVVRIAQDHDRAGVAGHVLDPARHVGEERVGDVEHDQTERVGAPGAQRPRGVVADEAEVLYRVQHPVAGGLGDTVRPVQHVRDRADRDARVPGHFLDAGRHAANCDDAN